MTAPKFERRDTDRRSGEDKRIDHMPVSAEHRKSDRRQGIERRLALQSAAGQLQTAMGLLLQLSDSAALNDEERRMLDTAMLRLRFAVERMASE
jgi:hypothetical protein